MWISRNALAGVAVAFLTACGGSSSLVWEDFDRTYLSIEARDGFVRSDDVVWVTGGGPGVGDTSSNDAVRMLYSFETGGISDDAVVESAFLRVYQEGVDGNPYGDLGNLIVDHVQIGADLDATDYAGNTLVSDVGTLSSSAAEAWKVVDVTAMVQADVTANRTYSEFRLRFSTGTDSDGSFDFAALNDGADSRGTGHIPQLVISYRAPRL